MENKTKLNRNLSQSSQSFIYEFPSIYDNKEILNECNDNNYFNS